MAHRGPDLLDIEFDKEAYLSDPQVKTILAVLSHQLSFVVLEAKEKLELTSIHAHIRTKRNKPYLNEADIDKVAVLLFEQLAYCESGAERTHIKQTINAIMEFKAQENNPASVNSPAQDSHIITDAAYLPVIRQKRNLKIHNQRQFLTMPL